MGHSVGCVREARHPTRDPTSQNPAAHHYPRAFSCHGSVCSLALSLRPRAEVPAHLPRPYLLLVRVWQEAAGLLKRGHDLLLGAVFLQVMFQIEDQFLAHLTEPVLLKRHMGYRKEDTGLNTGKVLLKRERPLLPPSVCLALTAQCRLCGKLRLL